MRRPLLAAMTVVLVIGACGTVRQSRLNPFNWFGTSTETVTLIVPQTANDPRLLVDQVTDMSIEPNKGGAIVRATGLPPTQGYWDGALTLDATASSDNALVYRFVVLPPITPTRVSTPQSRELTAAVYLSNIKLVGIRSITVQGARNARTSQR